MQFAAAPNKLGKQTILYSNPPQVVSFAAIVGDVEGQGRFGQEFDLVLEDDLWGEDSWEKAECKMFQQAVQTAAQKAELELTQIDFLLGGDLLNQIISSNFAARQLGLPFLGLYGACSTMAESLLLGSMIVSAWNASCVACVTGSHFSAAERQYRYPLEYGNQRTPTSQRTVTGSGATILADGGCNATNIFVTHGTVGRVVDLGITDLNNMGAAMAPGAADTIVSHLKDTERTAEDYDLIVTGDLGTYGAELCRQLCKEKGYDISKVHMDCGDRIFLPQQDPHAGGSGCGCSAVVLNGVLYKKMLEGTYNRILFLATGALMNPDISLQGESIPGIAHAVVLERRGQ